MQSEFDFESYKPQLYKFDTERLLTPALAIYPQIVRHNIHRILDLLGGDADRWRPHLKTAKLAVVMELLVEAGVTSAKCATTRELVVACDSGFRDVLVAFSHVGANALRVSQIATEHPEVRVSILIESVAQIAAWKDTPVSIFLDVNSGMDRTGIERSRIQEIVDQAHQVSDAGIEFRGLHFYDGHSTEKDLGQRTSAAHKRYDDLMKIVATLEAHGISVHEVVTTGTPALPCALSYPGFAQSSFLHQISPGTVVYNDLSSLKQLPAEYDLRPAVVVVSRVVSHPKAGVITCDAGHKSISVDSGVPNCAVLGEPAFVPMKPSEEHLPIEIPPGAVPPPLGTVLYLVPRHVCPTVNNANYAVLVQDGAAFSTMEVTARGHERPL